jgi:hypothetical protein
MRRPAPLKRVPVRAWDASPARGVRIAIAEAAEFARLAAGGRRIRTLTRSKAAGVIGHHGCQGPSTPICIEATLSTVQPFQLLFIKPLNGIGIRIIWCGRADLVNGGCLTVGTRRRRSCTSVTVPAATVIWVRLAL